MQDKVQQTQREYYLREQMKAIQKELGEQDETTRDAEELRQKIEAAGMPDDVKKEALKELGRLARMSPMAADYGLTRNYIEWLAVLPWQKSSGVEIDIPKAKEILDSDHYDLEKVKNRILDYLSVRRLKPNMKGPILCFVGPPGVGKTSLGKSIARSLGRKFVRLSLGGVHDEAEIRGHRRTYIGALPGQIIQGIRRAETNDPVFMLDEIDKVGRDFRGDPGSALLEALDPEQNFSFRDNYLDVPFDLSKVLFITTANQLDPVAEPLRDRMEIIELQGYTEEEKFHIAFQYLIPRQIEENGITKEQIEFPEETVGFLIRHYTREAGVRSLERTIGTICRKQARRIAEGKTDKMVVTPELVQHTDMLGGMKIRTEGEIAERTKRTGVAVGLAWTPTGGDILFIEANKMKGKGGFTMTGQLGQVMQESMQAALTWVRSTPRNSESTRNSLPATIFALRAHPLGQPGHRPGSGAGPPAPHRLPGPPVPAYFAQALVATEDHRFNTDPGVDPLALARVVVSWVTGQRDQGGSAIDQQLAKNLYTGGHSGFTQVLEQLAVAVKLNQTYSRPEILRMYAEIAYYGHGYYGLAAASCGYFGRTPDRLTLVQAAMLAGMVNAPTYDDPLVYPRQARARLVHVIGRMALWVT